MTEVSPVVSIITPTLNRKDYLAETIRSVQKQTFCDWEMVIVDDGSSAEIEAAVRELIKDDPRLRFFKRESRKKGACVCRNEGLEKSSGEYVLFLDSDDFLAPECLKGRLEAMRNNPAADFCVFYSQIFFKKPGDSKVLWNHFDGEDDLDRFTAFDIVWGPLSVIWKKNSLAKIGGWNEDLPSYQDYEYHVRSLARGLTYVKVPETDSFYRVGTPDSIGTRARFFEKAKHLSSKNLFFRSIVNEIKKNTKLTQERKKNISNLLSRTCGEMLSSKQPAEAFNLWFLGYALQLYGVNFFLKGLKTFFKIKMGKKIDFGKALFPAMPLGKQRTFFVYNKSVRDYQRKLIGTD